MPAHVDRGHSRPVRTTTPKLLELRGGACAIATSWNAGKNARACFEEDDTRVGRMDGAEVAPQGEAAQLRERAGELDARGAAADHDESEEAPALGVESSLGRHAFVQALGAV